MRIKTALRRVPGVLDAQADAQTQRVVVKANHTQVSPEQARAKLEEMGDQATAQE